jgi:hypothetical protein
MVEQLSIYRDDERIAHSLRFYYGLPEVVVDWVMSA